MLDESTIAGIKASWPSLPDPGVYSTPPDTPRDSEVILKYYYGNQELVGAEIGVSEGAHAMSLLRGLNIRKLYLIDPYVAYRAFYNTLNDSTHLHHREFAEAHLIDYSNKVEWIYEFSRTGIEKIQEPLDFAYVDANHRYRYVLMECLRLWPKIKSGGLLCGHDFTSCRKGLSKLEKYRLHNGVACAVNDFCIRNNIKGEHICEPHRCDWWIRKK